MMLHAKTKAEIKQAFHSILLKFRFGR